MKSNSNPQAQQTIAAEYSSDDIHSTSKSSNKQQVQTSSKYLMLDKYFEISKRGSSLKVELLAGLTTFMAMVYSVILIPSMLADVGFNQNSVFIATCLIAGFGSILIGL